MLRMPETYNDDLWRESEHDDSSSSMDSYLYLESSNDTEIVTVPAEHVPRVYSEVEQTFQQERFMRAFRLVMADINREIQDGGAPGSDTVQYADDTVQIQDTAPIQDTAQTQDTDTDTGTNAGTDTAAARYIDDTVQMQNSDTELASQTLQTQDSGIKQAQDTQDTQDN